MILSAPEKLCKYTKEHSGTSPPLSFKLSTNVDCWVYYTATFSFSATPCQRHLNQLMPQHASLLSCHTAVWTSHCGISSFPTPHNTTTQTLHRQWWWQWHQLQWGVCHCVSIDPTTTMTSAATGGNGGRFLWRRHKPSTSLFRDNGGGGMLNLWCLCLLCNCHQYHLCRPPCSEEVKIYMYCTWNCTTKIMSQTSASEIIPHFWGGFCTICGAIRGMINLELHPVPVFFGQYRSVFLGNPYRTGVRTGQYL